MTRTPTQTPAPGTVWTKLYGSTGEDRGQAVATDGAGNVAVTGSVTGNADFGGGLVTGHLSGSGGPTVDIFVAEYSASGGYLWARGIGDNSDEAGRAVAMDGSGNVLVTGYQGSYGVDYGGGPQYNGGGTAIFVAKYSSTGVWTWS
jgi:hypothetical protein